MNNGQKGEVELPVESMITPIKDEGMSVPGDRKRRAGVLKRAEVALQFGNAVEAASLCRSVLHSDPGHPGALEILARALWRSGKHEELIAVMRRLISINPYEPGYRTLLATAFECLGRYGEAIEAHRRSGTPESREAIEDLQIWQGSLVADLLNSDPVFRAHYSQNAYEACVSRGFQFSRVAMAENQWFQPSAYSPDYGRSS